MIGGVVVTVTEVASVAKAPALGTEVMSGSDAVGTIGTAVAGRTGVEVCGGRVGVLPPQADPTRSKRKRAIDSIVRRVKTRQL